jgi:hypothetical protein
VGFLCVFCTGEGDLQGFFDSQGFQKVGLGSAWLEWHILSNPIRSVDYMILDPKVFDAQGNQRNCKKRLKWRNFFLQNIVQVGISKDCNPINQTTSIRKGPMN